MDMAGMLDKLRAALFALTNELGLDVNLDTVNKVSDRTPNLCRPACGAPYAGSRQGGRVYAVKLRTHEGLLPPDAGPSRA